MEVVHFVIYIEDVIQTVCVHMDNRMELVIEDIFMMVGLINNDISVVVLVNYEVAASIAVEVYVLLH